MEETYDEIKELVESMADDAERFFEKDNKAAGRRLRKAAMEVKKLCHTFRGEISDEIKAK